METVILVVGLVVFFVLVWYGEGMYGWLSSKVRSIFAKNKSDKDEFSVKGVDEVDDFIKWLNDNGHDSSTPSDNEETIKVTYAMIPTKPACEVVIPAKKAVKKVVKKAVKKAVKKSSKKIK